MFLVPAPVGEAFCCSEGQQCAVLSMLGIATVTVYSLCRQLAYLGIAFYVSLGFTPNRHETERLCGPSWAQSQAKSALGRSFGSRAPPPSGPKRGLF